MSNYRIAGQDFYFPFPIPELQPFERKDGAVDKAAPFVPPSLLGNELISRTQGWVGGEQRNVETWSAPPGVLLKVSGASDLYIAPAGDAILPVNDWPIANLDRETLVGPALVLALAMRGAWSLHASAAMFRGRLVIFLGESGQGKSTLAAYLSDVGREWIRVADDILPVTAHSSGLEAWPRFPQLKLPVESWSGLLLPERIPISRICLLTNADERDIPELQLLAPAKAAQVLIGHTAGARLFDPRLLASHLSFAAEAARRVPLYALAYPRRWDALAQVMKILEASC
jgi:hypothetical protein